MKYFKLVSFSILALVSASLYSCEEPVVGDNELSKKEIAEGWGLLFDGKSTDQWHIYNVGKKSSAWKVKEGALVCDPTDVKIDEERGDLVSDKNYTNFEFAFDWKLSEAGNSGVFINVLENDTIPRAWASGPEYQLLESSHEDYSKKEKRSGTLYGFSEQKNPIEPNPLGEWNHSVIKQVDGKVEFYLNGVLTAEQDFNSQEWKDKIAASGFSRFPVFGKFTSGKISLQDWSKGVSFKNLKIREL